MKQSWGCKFGEGGGNDTIRREALFCSFKAVIFLTLDEMVTMLTEEIKHK